MVLPYEIYYVQFEYGIWFNLVPFFKILCKVVDQKFSAMYPKTQNQAEKPDENEKSGTRTHLWCIPDAKIPKTLKNPDIFGSTRKSEKKNAI